MKAERPILVRDQQTSAICDSGWSYYEEVAGAIYGIVPVATFPTLLGLAFQSFLLYTIVLFITSIFNMYSIFNFIKVVVIGKRKGRTIERRSQTNSRAYRNAIRYVN